VLVPQSGQQGAAGIAPGREHQVGCDGVHARAFISSREGSPAVRR
jgi:hypothetical protein